MDAVETLDEVPAALKLVRAMRRVHALSEIGYCQTQFDAMVRHMMSYGPDDLSAEDVEHPDSALSAEKKATLSRNKVYP